LDKLRSAEELTSLQGTLKRELDALDEEYGVLPMPLEIGETFAEKTEMHAEIGRRLDEWNGRKAKLAEMVEAKKVEAPAVIARKSEADIFDVEGVENGRYGARNPEQRGQQYRDNALRAAEIATFPNQATDVTGTRDRINLILDHHDSPTKQFARRVLTTGSPVYKRAFEKYLKGEALSPEEQRGTALAVGVDGTGGFAVPFAFDPTVIAIGVHGGAVNPYRRACRVVPIVGTDTWNALTATAVVATRTTEAAVTIEQGPTFAQPQYIVKRVQALITFSIEMGQDRPDLSSEMASLIQEAKDNEEETSFATGAGAASASIGVGPVNGTSGAYTSITTATSVTLAAADADATEAALPVRHRFGAQWFLNRLSIRRFQTLETAGGKLFGGNQYQAVGSVAIDAAGNTGLRLLGYPVNESPSLPTAQTANIVIGTLLAPQSYVIVDRVGMNVELVPHIFGAAQGNLPTGQRGLYAMWRNHAAPINVDAGRTLRYLT